MTRVVGAGGEVQVTRVDLDKVQPRNTPVLLTVLAGFCALVYSILFYVEHRITTVNVPAVPISVALELIDTGGENRAAFSTNADPAQTEKISGALRWLGTHSLNEYRLTAPPQDNAFYHFSRLLQMDPADDIALQGLLQVSGRYAILAERAIADGDYERARSCISIGLQVSPDNTTLNILRELGVPRDSGLIDALVNLFR